MIHPKAKQISYFFIIALGHFDWPIMKKTFKNLPSPPNPHIEMTCFQIVLHEHTQNHINVIVL